MVNAEAQRRRVVDIQLNISAPLCLCVSASLRLCVSAFNLYSFYTTLVFILSRFASPHDLLHFLCEADKPQQVN